MYLVYRCFVEVAEMSLEDYEVGRKGQCTGRVSKTGIVVSTWRLISKHEDIIARWMPWRGL